MSVNRGARRAVTIGFYLLGLLLVVELVFRALFSFDATFARLRGRDESSERLNWMLRHADRQQFVYKFDVHHPTRGWTLPPGIRDMAVFDGKVLNSNAAGLRGLREHAPERPPGTRRVLTFGDSFTFGDDVSDGETYSHFLEGFLPGTEVLNFGIHGYGHDQMLLYLQEEGIRYRPDIVVLGFVWFDMHRNLSSFNNFAKPKFEVRDGRLHLAVSSVPTPEQVAGSEFYRLKSLDALVILREKFRWALGWNDERARALSAAILGEFAATARRAGAAPVFVYLPVLAELDNPDPSPTPNERYLSGLCADLQVPCLFLRPLFAQEAKKGVTFVTRGHWLAKEHAIAARGIADFLRQQGRLPEAGR